MANIARTKFTIYLPEKNQQHHINKQVNYGHKQITTTCPCVCLRNNIPYYRHA